MGYEKIVLKQEQWKTFRKSLNDWCQQTGAPENRGDVYYYTSTITKYVFKALTNVIQITPDEYLLVSHTGEGNDFITKVKKQPSEDLRLTISNEINGRELILYDDDQKFKSFLIEFLVLASGKPTAGITDEIEKEFSTKISLWLEELRRIRTRAALIKFINQEDRILLPGCWIDWLNAIIGQAYVKVSS